MRGVGWQAATPVSARTDTSDWIALVGIKGATEYMRPSAEAAGMRKQLMGVVGTLLLLAILGVKLSRHLELPIVSAGAGDVLPSLFGPAGLLLLIRSGTGRISQLSLTQTAVLVGCIAVGLELAQLLPKPGLLARVHYTFDSLDLGASLVSIVAGYLLARVLVGAQAPDPSGQ